MNIVLVHGGWHGGWCWREVADQLRAMGHRVFAPTLTGLGERQHLAHSEITPTIHVKDIANVIDFEELDQVILVGHSYGGFIISGVASLMPEKIEALVYLDAFVPTESGQSAFSIGTKERADEIKATIQDGFLVPASGFERWVSDPVKQDWLKQRVTPHPIRCFSEGPELSGAEQNISKKMYIWCKQHNPSPFVQFHERYKSDPAWRSKELACLHDAMIEMPKELSTIIDSMSKEP